MSRFSFLIKEEALEDIEIAYEWYQKEYFGLGKRFKEEVRQSLTRISAYLENYSFVKELQPIRKIRLKRFPYCIYFLTNNDVINVLAVIHTSRSDRFIKKRLT